MIVSMMSMHVHDAHVAMAISCNLLRGLKALLSAALLLVCCSVGPLAMTFWAQKGWISNEQGVWSYIWPPSQVPDFALGCLAAELAVEAPAFQGLLADLSLLLVALCCFLVPSSGAREGWEPFFGHALCPFYASFLICSAKGQGLTTRLLRHEALVALGDFSFEADACRRLVDLDIVLV